MSRLLVVGEGLISYSRWPTPSQNILNDVLLENGLRESDVRRCAPKDVFSEVRKQRPNVILALGNPAATACIPGLEEGVDRVRGFIFEGVLGIKVIPSVDPEIAVASWVPWRVLLSYDLKRAKEESTHAELRRPERSVHVVRSLLDAQRVATHLRGSVRVAADIEISGPTELLCVGFAADSRNAFVYPARFASAAYDLLRTLPGLCFQNGQFDAHFLSTRCGIDVKIADDTLVAWHSCYPELAGASQDAIGRRRGGKRTHKSLHFLSSLFTKDSWWKNYDTDDAGMYHLCGLDCCNTFEIMEALDAEIDRLGVRRIYAHTLRLLQPCVAMQARGLPIDESLRISRVEALSTRLDSASETMNALVRPLLEKHIGDLPPEVASLFQWRRVCPCCRNGAGKLSACWSCAGFPKKPGKRELAASGLELRECVACEGHGEFTGIKFNPRSGPQKLAILYDILKLPVRYVEGRPSTDADSLKSLLALVA